MYMCVTLIADMMMVVQLYRVLKFWICELKYLDLLNRIFTIMIYAHTLFLCPNAILVPLS